MNLVDAVPSGWLDRHPCLGPGMLGALIFSLASATVLLIRSSTRRIESHLSDVTALQFGSAQAQLLTRGRR